MNQKLPEYIDGQKLLSDLEYSLMCQKEQIFFSKLWNDEISTKLDFLRKFKTKYEREDYLNTVKNFKHRKYFTRLRLSNHPLRIETGRYFGELRHERICKFCSLKEVESESHFLLFCTLYDHLRIPFYSELNKHFTSFNDFSDEQKLQVIMKPQNSTVGTVVTYISKCIEKRSLILPPREGARV